MNQKKIARIRRSKPTRMKIREKRVFRLSVYRTPKHIYAQVISPDENRVVAQASTLDRSLRDAGATGNVSAAERVGRLVAERAKAVGINSVAFDRGGFKYHGRVKALADAARLAGLDF